MMALITSLGLLQLHGRAGCGEVRPVPRRPPPRRSARHAVQERPRRWRDCHPAAPPSAVSRRFNRDGEGGVSRMTEVSRRCQERPGECGGDGQRRLAAGVDVPDWGWYMGTPPHTTWTILQHDGPNHLGLCCNAALCASNGPDHLGSCCPSGFAVVGTVLSVRSPPPALQTTPSSV